MRTVKFILLVFLSIFSFGLKAQSEFKFDNLVYLLDGKDIGSNEIYQYENLNVLIQGLRGCVEVDGKIELGMEVVITDDNSNRLLYSPDMLVDIELQIEDIPQLQFNLNLTEDFLEGEEYFIKIKVWDKGNKRSYSKHSSFRIIPALRNENIYIDVRRLKLSGYQLYLNGDRLYKHNVMRKNDEVVVDLFFRDLKYEKGEDVIIITEIIDEQTSKKYKLEEDFILAEKSDELKSVLIKTDLNHPELKDGTEYVYHMQFHNASRNQKLDFKFTFTYYDNDWRTYSNKISGLGLKAQLNKEKAKSGEVVEVGDKLDFQIVDFKEKIVSDFGFGKIGAAYRLYDPTGKILYTTKDLYEDFGRFSLDLIKSINYEFKVPFDLEENSKYTLELILWDKYDNSTFTKKFSLKTAKRKDEPFGLTENIHLKFKHNVNKVDPVAVYVLKNDYRTEGNKFNVGDEISLITAINLNDASSKAGLKRIVQLVDPDGNLLSQDEEDIKDFAAGQIYADIAIPEFGVLFNKEYKLINILQQGETELFKTEFTFTITK